LAIYQKMNSSDRCLEITLKNKRCKKRKQGESYCNIHYKECSICYDELKNKLSLQCGHSFCKECIYRWIVKSGTCPMCRRFVEYRERLDSINHNIYNGNLITITSYRFTVDSVLFPEFINYIEDLIDFETYTARQDWEVFKMFLGLDDHIHRIFCTLPRMKFVHYTFVEDYTDSFPIELDENETKNVYKYKIEII
jgi:hypothetical protein